MGERNGLHVPGSNTSLPPPMMEWAYQALCSTFLPGQTFTPKYSTTLEVIITLHANGITVVLSTKYARTYSTRKYTHPLLHRHWTKHTRCRCVVQQYYYILKVRNFVVNIYYYDILHLLAKHFTSNISISSHLASIGKK